MVSATPLGTHQPAPTMSFLPCKLLVYMCMEVHTHIRLGNAKSTLPSHLRTRGKVKGGREGGRTGQLLKRREREEGREGRNSLPFSLGKGRGERIGKERKRKKR